MSNLQTNCHLKLISKKWTNIQEESGYPTAPNTTWTISCNAYISPVEYSRWDKSDIKESNGNIFNPIFYKKVQGQKHPGGERLWNQNYLVSESQNL